MFGLGFGEMVVLGVVLIVVVGPRELPKLLRSLGSGIRKLREMSSDLREQSGIDDIINEEGLREDLDTIRSLSKGRVVDGLVNASRPAKKPARRPRVIAKTLQQLTVPQGDRPERDDEYPSVGPDAYGALPDDATDEEVAAALKAIEEKEAEEAAKQAEAEKKAKAELEAMESKASEDVAGEDPAHEDVVNEEDAHRVDDEPLFDLSPPEGTVEAGARSDDAARVPAEESAS